MPTPRTPRSRSAVRPTALALSTALVATLLQFVSTAPAYSLPGLPDAEKPVKVQGYSKVIPRTTTPGPRTPSRAPRAERPASAKRTVELSGSSAGAPSLRRVGKLPVSIGAALGENAKSAAETAPSSVDVQVLGDDEAQRAGTDGMLLTLEPTDLKKRSQEAVPVSVRVDYKGFSEAYGGSYASRLQLVQLPACALDTDKGGKCTADNSALVEAVNDPSSGTLTADRVMLKSAQPTVLAVTAAADGATGTYKATSLSPSSSWDTQLNTGDFTWQYPMPVPEVPGAMSPSVGLNYSAQSIDGRTTATNNQGSWIGDGFEYAPGFIERRYKPCADDGEKNADGSKPGDLCWGYDNAFLTFNGSSSELVPSGTDEFKLKKDDGTRIARLKSSNRGNGDNDGEYWRLTSPDGTRYYFGYHRLPGWAEGKDTTNSTWTVPVFGNNEDEPCNAVAFADSWCQQGWRWNLDYVVDPHSNAMAYHYAKETNSYGRNLKGTDDTPYVRGGYLTRADYGLKSSKMYADKPLAQVVYTSEERCIPETGVTCDEDTIVDKSFYWYDTPWDLNCRAGTKCEDTHTSPTFWTRKRLTGVTTQVLQTDGTYGKIDTWKLAHRWGMADTDYQLLLDSVQHTGHKGTESITLPKTTLAYTQLPNRLDKTGDGYAPFIKSRLSTVADESGGQTDVAYSSPACDAANLPNPQSNTTRCFPQYYGGGWNEDPTIHWFNKYVTTAVTDTDRTGGSPDQVTRYDYLGGGAWHWDDNGLTKDKERTWSQWRGYGHVRVRSGGQGGDSAMKSQEEHYFLRGMDGDRKDTGGTSTKDVSVTLGADEGDPITDHDAWAGFEYKQTTFDAPGGKILAKTVSRPWRHETASKKYSWATLAANFTGTNQSKTFNSLDAGAGSKWRTTSVATTFDTVAGRPVQADNFGDGSTSTDNECTRTTYATNTGANILNLTSRVETVAGSCADTPDRSKDVISDVRTAYDGGAYGAAPTKGDATATATLKSHDGTKATYLEAGATFDSYPRQLTTTDLTANVTVTKDGTPARTPRTDGRTTTTAYIPATGMPTQLKSTTPPSTALDATTAQTTTRDLDPLRGQVVKETDTNNNVTETAFDALGRTTKVWLADRRNSQTPSYEFAYTVAEGAPVAVATKKLDNNGGQITSYVLYDGQMRERQSQAPGPDGGRILADTFYDERGLAAKSFAPYYAEKPPSSTLSKPVDALSVQTQTRTTYDGLERPVEVKQIAGNGDGGTVLQTSKTIYGGDRTTIIPPVGATATTTLTDAHGRTTELRRHHTRSADSPYDATTYGYTLRGELKKVTDPAGNIWSTTYDQMGRPVEESDPAKGKSTIVYDDRGQVTSTTDARKTTLVNVYDNLGRRTAVHTGSTTGPLRAKWTYDTVTGAKGQIAESTRYENGEAYTTKVTAYDRLYRPYRTALTIPASEGALAGTYQTGTTYKPSGLLAGTTYSAAGALPGGTVSYGYEDQTLRQNSVFGQGMSTSTAYSLTGKPLQYTLGLTAGGNKTQITNTYEWGTQRLATTRVDRENQSGVDRNVTYRYDEAGNVLSQSDVSRTGTDNQCYTYDHLQRLTDAWTAKSTTCASQPKTADIGGPAPYWQSYTYDKAGNRLTEVRHDTGGDSTKDTKSAYAYTPPGTTDANQLTGVTTTQGSTTNSGVYAYDDSGNTTNRPGQNLTWDAEGHLATTTDAKGTTSYLYDTDGNRLISRTPSKTILDLGHTEVTLDKGATTAKATRYISLGGGNQAIRNNDGTFAFTLADHQGTGNLAVNASNLALSQQRTLPFGGTRGTATGTMPGTKGFVGGTDETTTTGLVHLGAREYDPTIGRFISVDPILDVTDSQQMNGYNYANNSPVTLSDPDGLRPIGPTDSVRGDEEYAKKHHGSQWTNNGYGWYWKNVQQTKIPGYGTVTVTNYIGSGTANHPAPRGSVTFQAIKPKPKEVTVRPWMGGGISGPSVTYTPAPLKTWQKIVLGIASGVSAGVILAPVALAIGPEIAAACLANPAGCATVAAELTTGGAGGAGAYSAARSTVLGGKYYTPATGLKGLINPGGGTTNCRACVISLDQMMATGARSNALPKIERGSVSVIEKFYGRKFRSRSFSNIVGDMQEAGDGARGIVYGMDKQGGHVFNVINNRGRVTFLDGQSGDASHAPTWDSFQLMRTN
ncbi:MULTISPECIES: RHS repeat-associated core domain-containing protein [Streptomyces]|uniref:RHS repeat-associated core domain-containing protein n=1 Tax=Streptomyces TaxID=1883 RepID=UPI001FAC5C8F|nr:RHS repeat-associated core domain-containing protein [Streptomyces sp. PBSH9]